MKHNYLILMAITLVLGIALFGCKKDSQENLTPKITEDNVEVTATTATFTWTVDWPGKLMSVVEVSENEDMSSSQIYGSEEETENHDFTVTVTDLKAATKYYYRYWVWNMFYEDNKYEMEIKKMKTIPLGVVKGVFSISSRKKVYFSQGNLQYRASDERWCFAEHQYDCIGNNNSSISSSYDGWIDLFGWGTSGWNSGAICYQPYSISTNYSDYCPGGSYNNLTGYYENADWGVYNAIYNGGNIAGMWRTLTNDEWVYLFSGRNKSSYQYANGSVNGINGLIILPDNWTLPSGLDFNPFTGYSYTVNSYTKEEWSQMEANGAVFLPAAGDRRETSVNNVGSLGYYWSASYYDEKAPYHVRFSGGNTGGNFEESAFSYRYYGMSVRLVTPAE